MTNMERQKIMYWEDVGGKGTNIFTQCWWECKLKYRWKLCRFLKLKNRNSQMRSRDAGVRVLQEMKRVWKNLHLNVHCRMFFSLYPDSESTLRAHPWLQEKENVLCILAQ